MPCPWYKNGMCTSPKLLTPSSSVVSTERCLGGPEQYKTCNFYVEPESGQGVEQRTRSDVPSITEFSGVKSSLDKKLKPYPPIHLLDQRPLAQCPYMKVYEYGGGYLAYCAVLERLLTRSEVELCEQHWRSCPFRRIAASIGRTPVHA